MRSYVLPHEAAEYHEQRLGAARWRAMPLERQEGALVWASDYVDVMFGLPVALVREMRGGGEVPSAVKAAVCEIAMLEPGSVPRQKSIAKGALSLTLEDTPEAKTLAYVRRLLAPLVRQGGFRLQRG